MKVGLVSLVAAATVCASACSGQTTRPRATTASSRTATVASTPVAVVGQIEMALAPAEVARECHETANAAGYAVPCPTLLPAGFRPTPTPPVAGACPFAFIQYRPVCHGWPGWFFGSSQTSSLDVAPDGFQHLVVQGAPDEVTSPARAIDGPAVPPGPVKAEGIARLSRITYHLYEVPPDNPSAFRGHLVLVWNEGGHTYAYGFHIVVSLRATRRLDLELAAHLVLVRPRDS